MTGAIVDTEDALGARLADLRRRIDAGLPTVVEGTSPAGLYDPMRYALDAGGKRIRPLLTLLAADLYGAAADALGAALAVEVFHTFTLVHDDIMDAAPTRRGRPTVHTRWDVPTAILAGDLLLGEAYRLVADSPRGDLRAMLATWTDAVRRLCEGQALDMAFETDDAVTLDAYLDMIDRKTGALLACALELGGHIGGADENDRAALCDLGYAVGRAFQIQDDLLDLTADSADWGKAVGGDVMEGKKTYLLLRALDVATGDDADVLHALVAAKGCAPDAVPDVRARMDRLGVLDDARRAVADWTQAAAGALGRLPAGLARDALARVIDGLGVRTA